ncbi:ribbon-helix-helix domain-containing protein [Mesorhizobium sp.]|uniref:ribbon-helix-helix domain-containing protein n=1 Tax=Mesorhizobium sp. TaxID=1871066 RepID=UPI0025C44FDD|nr:ribbon-helix-helix domain-containing protein [Mesorhizobium sp.]
MPRYICTGLSKTALLDEIAESQGLTTPKFISIIYDEAIEIIGQIPNFASMLRTTCALYLRGHRPAVGEQAALKQVAVMHVAQKCAAVLRKRHA